MIEIRMRTKISEEEMQMKVGKMLVQDDINAVLTGPAKVLKPNGTVLCVYLPKAISKELRDEAYPVLHMLKNSYTSNRGLASGTERVKGASKTSYARSVDSAIIGAFDRSPRFNYCRLTAWTGKETEAWTELFPFLKEIARLLEENVPDRYANQMREAQRTAPEWVIPGTPFTTVTVNNTYATGVHTDKGDLNEGFSTITALRRGEFNGGTLCFPEYRLGVDLQDGDLLLMDAHEWHGNIEYDPKPERDLDGKIVGDPGFERISVVSYFRTNMVQCGSAQDEMSRRALVAENKTSALIGE